MPHAQAILFASLVNQAMAFKAASAILALQEPISQDKLAIVRKNFDRLKLTVIFSMPNYL